MKVHKAGIGIINWATALLIVFNLICWLLISSPILKISFAIASFVVYLMIIQFFRYPQRKITSNEKLVISPADGKVCDIKENVEVEYLKTQCKQISIFMSPLNVHINWIPVVGKITYMKHKDGEFYAAFKDKSAEENERMTTAVLLNNGREIVIRQIAGAMARRIINFIEVDQQVDQTVELGFIRFGSRVDLFLPLDAKIKVKLNQKVTGSQTVIAEL
ncbi:MAG: phosphatidylserine decarboxylase [Bacteroidetes bacterium GWF2_42_66]|nr:MAG: phosphatidylserine decarboxylase [Bacteroidetes bacterium GWA2_42_15]OFX97053.1 MAG: phosphatidylserine decarboxylase [Bacteroidetes bacterium GWE2_42_39]OFY46143.1 MAG: phosphatidylserine decarboxylase [Bacteroidetes bacterium GWF2_42_66]HBL75651.1 phosphatidylserine decarboxylase family protein [Prolixibacteraceae bacterium]HCR91133.1 phosphatidylserine decarboxylase family protein [Prolixibacteraceae bacterium]